MITSKDNARIKRISALGSSAKKRRESGVFLLEGTRLCGEALREDIEVKEMFYTSSVAKSDAELIENLKQRAEFCDEVSDTVFAKMSGQIEVPVGGRFLAFERVQDPSNLGAASRTAEALGFSGLIISNLSTDPYSPKSLRASMGALLRLPLIITNDFKSTLLDCQNRGFKLNGTVVGGDAIPINRVNFGENEIAVIGNEATGMTEEIKQICDRLITIPMTGRAESLNAAAAAGIVMWEMCR